MAEYGDNRVHFRDFVFIPADVMAGDHQLNFDLVVEDVEFKRGNDTVTIPQLKIDHYTTSALERIVWHRKIPKIDFFDRPTMMKYFGGTLLSLNKYIQNNAGSAYISLSEEKGLNIFVNCHQDHIDERLANPIAKDDFEIAAGQGIWNAILPHTLEFQFKEALGVAFMLGGKSILAGIEAMNL